MSGHSLVITAGLLVFFAKMTVLLLKEGAAAWTKLFAAFVDVAEAELGRVHQFIKFHILTS